MTMLFASYLSSLRALSLLAILVVPCKSVQLHYPASNTKDIVCVGLPSGGIDTGTYGWIDSISPGSNATSLYDWVTCEAPPETNSVLVLRADALTATLTGTRCVFDGGEYTCDFSPGDASVRAFAGLPYNASAIGVPTPFFWCVNGVFYQDEPGSQGLQNNPEQQLSRFLGSPTSVPVDTSAVDGQPTELSGRFTFGLGVGPSLLLAEIIMFFGALAMSWLSIRAAQSWYSYKVSSGYKVSLRELDGVIRLRPNKGKQALASSLVPLSMLFLSHWGITASIVGSVTIQVSVAFSSTCSYAAAGLGRPSSRMSEDSLFTSQAIGSLSRRSSAFRTVAAPEQRTSFIGGSNLLWDAGPDTAEWFFAQVRDRSDVDAPQPEWFTMSKKSVSWSNSIGVEALDTEVVFETRNAPYVRLGSFTIPDDPTATGSVSFEFAAALGGFSGEGEVTLSSRVSQTTGTLGSSAPLYDGRVGAWERMVLAAVPPRAMCEDEGIPIRAGDCLLTALIVCHYESPPTLKNGVWEVPEADCWVSSRSAFISSAPGGRTAAVLRNVLGPAFYFVGVPIVSSLSDYVNYHSYLGAPVVQSSCTRLRESLSWPTWVIAIWITPLLLLLTFPLLTVRLHLMDGYGSVWHRAVLSERNEGGCNSQLPEGEDSYIGLTRTSEDTLHLGIVTHNEPTVAYSPGDRIEGRSNPDRHYDAVLSRV